MRLHQAVVGWRAAGSPCAAAAGSSPEGTSTTRAARPGRQAPCPAAGDAAPAPASACHARHARCGLRPARKGRRQTYWSARRNAKAPPSTVGLAGQRPSPPQPCPRLATPGSLPARWRRRTLPVRAHRWRQPDMPWRSGDLFIGVRAGPAQPLCPPGSFDAAGGVAGAISTGIVKIPYDVGITKQKGRTARPRITFSFAPPPKPCACLAAVAVRPRRRWGSQWRRQAAARRPLPALPALPAGSCAGAGRTGPSSASTTAAIPTGIPR